MLGNVNNVEKVHKINFLIILTICALFFLQYLMGQPQNYLVDLMKPFIIIFTSSVVYFVKTNHYKIKAILLSLIPSCTLFYLVTFTQEKFTVSNSYIVIISLVMVGMYFNHKIIISYTFIQDVLMVIILFLKPLDFIVSSHKQKVDGILVIILFNIIATIIAIMAKWGNSIIDKSLSSYLELSALYGEVADRDREIISKSNEIIMREEQIGSLYNQVAASEEELKLQYNTINEKIEYLAYHDSLTGLPNRVLFYDRLTMSINERNRKNERLGVILMDLDNFKMINDGFSHSLGDEVLRTISHRLSLVVRESDTLARFGGDGFAILLNAIKDYKDIIKLAERVSMVLSEPIRINEQEIYVHCSMGFAVYPIDGENCEELLKSADTALIKAKANGKNCYQFYNKAMKSDMLQKIELEKKVKDGLKNKEFVLYFQPQIDILNNKIRGFEALVRWNSGKELIPPNKFIPIAEETGLIVELGEWILMEACCKNREWARLYNTNVIISVNISVIQLNHSSFVQYVKKALEVSGMKPEFLELEITESMFIGSFEDSVSKLNELRQLGVKIALDDFGTGYSSLNYLQNLPIDTLKIDKSFIDGISNMDKSKDIVGAIINLIQSLGLNTIAEGVETKEQLKYLTQNGCENVQGYIFSRPLPAKDVVNKLFEDYSEYAI